MIPTSRNTDPDSEATRFIDDKVDLDVPPLSNLEAVTSTPVFSKRKDHSDVQYRQALRLRRLRLVFIAGLYLAALEVLHFHGMITLSALIRISAMVAGTMLGFYVVFASGVNQKFADRMLTAPIAVVALSVMLGALYIAPASRLIFTPFVFIVIAFGMYRLGWKAMLFLNFWTLAGYAGVIGMQSLQEFDKEQFDLSVLCWLVLTLSLPAFAMLAAQVRHLHSALYRAGLKIRDIEENARRDQLLGCYNRRYMIAALEEQKRLADETSAPLCLAIIDLDHFKEINDDVGHLAGDEVLRSFSHIAEENTRQGDIFGRYGGEEFVLILPKTPLRAAQHTAERIREQVEIHCGIKGLWRTVTVSIGLTQYIPGESVLNLFSRTDAAMYLAKRSGRNRVAVEQPGIWPWQPREKGSGAAE